ncbi:MAG: DUF4214 domain-containing protein [Roseibium sp.]|nr:DUF4214 domain-containing protein [Roseibium sp.]
MSTAQEIVSRFYVNVLQRDGEESEITTYTNQILSQQKTTWDVLNDIINSQEASDYIDPIVKLYYAGLDRRADVTGIDHWVDALRDGTSTLLQIANGFVNSQEWSNTYGSTEPTGQVIAALYQNVLLREGSAAEIQAWQDTGLSTAEILLGFSNSIEFDILSQGAIDADKGDAGKYDISYYGWNGLPDPLTTAADFIATPDMTPTDLVV